jgi:hypothetical protein
MSTGSMMATAALAALSTFAAGCASTPSFAPAAHCTAAIPAGMARVVASRTSSSLGGAVPIGVHDDGQPIGELGPGGRVCWLRHAGTAFVTAYLPARAPHTAHDIDLPLAAGETATIETALGAPWKRLGGR